MYGLSLAHRPLELEREALRASPKKHCNLRGVAATSVAMQRKTLSPSNKKMSSNSNSSRSPKKSPATVSGAVAVVAHESQAIQTAKRLKKLIGSPTSSSANVSSPRRKQRPDEGGHKTMARSKKCSSSSEDDVAVPTEPSIDVADAVETAPVTDDAAAAAAASTTLAEIKAESANDSGSTMEMLSWSRDEDKIVLEQIKMGFTSEEELVQTLQTDQLPRRSLTEIQGRFRFLMDIIANL